MQPAGDPSARKGRRENNTNRLDFIKGFWITSSIWRDISIKTTP